MTWLNVLVLCCLIGTLLVISNLWFVVRVLRPIRKLSLQAEQLTQGKFDSLERECGGIQEVQTLQRAMSGMVGHVRRAQEQQRAYTEQLANGQENERKRIARELHDDTVQSIIAINHSIEMAKNWIQTDPNRTTQMLQLAREQAIETVVNLRNLIGGLRPPALEELGLIPALEMLLSSIQIAPVNFNINGEPRRLMNTQELALFRIVQEALQNITRHSQAKHIQIDVDYQSAGVLLKVKDDGLGFRIPSNLGELMKDEHYGLLGIQERIANWGGQFEIESQPGQGTTLSIYMPTQYIEQPDSLVRDPVCSATIEPQQAYGSITYQGKAYYFCCPVCQGEFQKNPAQYTSATPMP